MLNLSGPYKLSTDVSCENFDGEYVVLNLASGHYFALSPSCSIVFDGLLKGFDVGDMTDTLAGAEPARREEIGAFLARMIDYGLIEPDAEAMARPLTADWSDAARGALGPILLEAFDDIADLITSDPIHDTDESAGWPVKKEA
jgi:hypothetical protein